jgi:hypothetical protein
MKGLEKWIWNCWGLDLSKISKGNSAFWGVSCRESLENIYPWYSMSNEFEFIKGAITRPIFILKSLGFISIKF